MPRKILFIHPNFPGQFRHLLKFCAGQPELKVDFITEALPVNYPGVEIHRSYAPGRTRTESVTAVLLELKQRGYSPDLVVSHSGWGGDLHLLNVFPAAKFLSYPEWYYHTGNPRNLTIEESLKKCTCAMVPTEWQKSRFPKQFQGKIRVIHEGVDTAFYKPVPNAVFTFFGRNYSATDEIVTYAARGQEPIRGFPEFMRALPAVLAARPQAKILIAGEDRVCYGAQPPGGKSWRQTLNEELKLPEDRVIFCNKLPEEYFVKLLQVSSLHVYLSKKFVLSWSLLNAMSCGCLILGSSGESVSEVLKDGHNGLSCELDSGAIAAAVIRTLEQKSELVSLRKQARQDILMNYDAAQCVQKQYQLIKELLL